MIPPSYPIGTAAVTENLLKRRWSITILRHLANSVNNPADICKLEPSISMAAMNERLRNMLRFSLITRYPRASASKVIEYQLTTRGRDVLKILNLIEQLDLEGARPVVIDDGQTLPPPRRTKPSPTKKRMIALPDSPRLTVPLPNPRSNLAQAS